MPSAPPLLELVLQVRERAGRPVTDADRTRLQQKISAMTQVEVTAERAMLRRLLAVEPMPNRDRP